MSAAPAPEDRGAALIAVLAVVAAMSVAALIALDAVARSVVLSKAGDRRAQAAWYAYSAGALAETTIADLRQLTGGAITLETPGLGEPVVLPLRDATIEATLTDMTNCFNLNALAAPGEGRGAWDVNSEALAAYERLLVALGLFESDAAALADALADWIDGDLAPRGRGAEDGYYVTQAPPYRTSSALLDSKRELKAVLGYTEEIRALIDPVVCALPWTEQHALNLNTLSERQAALLPALYSEFIDADTADALLRQRPRGGWPTVEDFLLEPAVGALAPDKRRDERITTQSSYFKLTGIVAYDGGELPFEAVLAAELNQPVRLVRRRHGEE